MFGINALSQPELIQNLTVPPCLATSLVTVPRQAEMLPVDKSFYHFCFVYPLVLVTHSLQKLKHKEEIKEKGKEAEELGYGAYFCDFLTWFFSHKSKRLQAVPPFQWSPSLEKIKSVRKNWCYAPWGGSGGEALEWSLLLERHSPRVPCGALTSIFFPMIFLTRATDFAEKEGLPVVYKSTSLFISRAAF